MRYEKWWEDHFDEYFKVLSDYVSIKSIAIPSADIDKPFGAECRRMLDHMHRVMQDYGLDARIYNSVFAEGRIKGSGKNSKTVAVVCHGDVVPAENGWEKDPFTLYRKDDHLVGRGTTDNKGAAVAVLFSLRCLLENGWRPKNDFVLRIGCAEEIGMKDVPLAYDMPPADFTLVPDSGFPIAFGEKGSVKASFSLDWDSEITIEGGNGTSVIGLAYAKNCAAASFVFPDGIRLENGVLSAKGIQRHPAMPEGGKDASVMLLEYLLSENLVTDPSSRKSANTVCRLFSTFYGEGLGLACSDEMSGPLTAVLTSIKAENGKLKGTLSIRFPVSCDASHIEDKLKKVLSSCHIDSFSSGYMRPMSPQLEKLNEISCRMYGCSKPAYIMAGGTYARMFPGAVAYGMGSPLGNIAPPFPKGEGRAHQKNESVHIERMKKGFLIYAEALAWLDDNL